MDGEFRLIFDTIPEEFDKRRPRYCPELFRDLTAYACIDPRSEVLELGPGTGQASEPLIDTGCDYNAIELGSHMTAKMIEKFGQKANFHIVNDDFITHDFGDKRFDLIYSAATIQWIPEEVAFSKTFSLLKPGGTLAMMLTKGDFQTPNPVLYDKIEEVYAEYFKPEIPYTHGSFRYENAVNYGYVGLEKRTFSGIREFNADGYVALCKTHSDHLVIPEPYAEKLFSGLRKAVLDAGDRIVFHDTHILYLAKKPKEV